MSFCKYQSLKQTYLGDQNVFLIVCVQSHIRCQVLLKFYFENVSNIQNDQYSHTVRLVTPFTCGLYAHLKSLLVRLEWEFKCAFPAVRLVICPLYGLDINVYNKCYGVYRYQDALDCFIPKINAYISKVNERNRVRTPFICNVLHRHRPKKNSYIQLYHRLRDGLHPGEFAQRKIVVYLLRCFEEDL